MYMYMYIPVYTSGKEVYIGLQLTSMVADAVTVFEKEYGSRCSYIV